MNPIFGREGTKKVLVISHERSGTHFLMNTIADNFGYVSDPWIDVDDVTVSNPYSPSNILEFLMSAKGQPVINVFKSHYPSDFFMGVGSRILDEYAVFYIKRKPGPCLRSFRKFISRRPWNSGPVADNDEEFKNMQPWGGALRYQLRQYDSMLERHKEHIASYAHEPWDRATHLTYEELDTDFDATVAKIGQTIGIKRLDKPIRPTKAERVVN